MPDPATAADDPHDLDLAVASRALVGMRDMLAADGYDMSLRAIGADTLAVEIVAGPDACAECLVPKHIMSGIITDALGSLLPVAHVLLSYPADSSH